MLSLLMLVTVPAVVRGHGGMVWPPIWQDARGVSVDNYVTGSVGSNPVVRDPATGRRINYVKSWLTDQAYTGGHGPEARGTGPATNPTCPAWARKLRYIFTRISWYPGIPGIPGPHQAARPTWAAAAASTAGTRWAARPGTTRGTRTLTPTVASLALAREGEPGRSAAARWTSNSLR